MAILGSMLHGFLPFSSVLIPVWFERSLHYAHVNEQSCPRPLKVDFSQKAWYFA